MLLFMKCIIIKTAKTLTYDLEPVESLYNFNEKGGNKIPCNIYIQIAGNSVEVKQ